MTTSPEKPVLFSKILKKKDNIMVVVMVVMVMVIVMTGAWILRSFLLKLSRQPVFKVA